MPVRVRSASGKRTAVERRTALLEATIAEIAKRGTRGMRVEHVAKAADVSVALIYHHFGDRATLLQRALEHVGERADRYTSPRPGPSARATLTATLLDELQDDPGVRTNSAAWGELRDTAIFDPGLRPTLAALTARWVDDIATLVRSGQADGSIATSVPPERVAIQLTALVEGMSGRWLAELVDTGEARAHLADGIDALLGQSG